MTRTQLALIIKRHCGRTMSISEAMHIAKLEAPEEIVTGTIVDDDASHNATIEFITGERVKAQLNVEVYPIPAWQRNNKEKKGKVVIKKFLLDWLNEEEINKLSYSIHRYINVHKSALMVSSKEEALATLIDISQTHNGI